MSNPRHLSKPPIREAVIDIQVSEPVSLDALGKISDHLKDKLYTRDEMWQSSIAIAIQKDGKGGANADRTPVGYRFTFSDCPHVILCQAKGFTFSHLSPYSSWGEMSSVAKELWEIYRGATNPRSISRIAVRYINSMPIPLPITDFADYLVVPPVVPEGLPQLLASFLQRFVMVDNVADTVAVVTQVLEEVTQVDRATILLDIDVYKTYPNGFSVDTASIWPVLEDLRNFKNRVFFDYLTDRTIRMFE